MRQRRHLVWQTWLTQRVLGYVHENSLCRHVANLLGMKECEVRNVIKLTKMEDYYP